MAPIVYALCALLSFACAFFLYRGYRENRVELLFWSSIGFLGFALNNALLLTDHMIGSNYDLSVIRTLPALVGMVLLIYGLVNEST